MACKNKQSSKNRNVRWNIKKQWLFENKYQWAIILCPQISLALHDWKVPENHIDHKDGIKDNNKWENLREATYSQNNKNRAAYGKVDKNIYPYRGRFAVRVCLGTYNTKEEAIAIRDKFLKEFKFEDEFIHSSLRV